LIEGGTTIDCCDALEGGERGCENFTGVGMDSELQHSTFLVSFVSVLAVIERRRHVFKNLFVAHQLVEIIS
jgi:hypothetical protein